MDQGAPTRGVHRELTGEVQYMHRLAASGMSERHSGHFFTSEVLTGAASSFFSRFIILTTMNKAKATITKSTSVLMKRP